MQQLRSETRVVHARIEASLPLLDPALTLSRYMRVLEAFHGFYAKLEPRIVSAAGLHGSALLLDERAKLPLLVLDLRALGRSSPEIDSLPRCEEVTWIGSESRALGALYVLEGATLGGQIIGAKLRASLGIEAENGAAFFNGYGERTRGMWQRFSNHIHAADDFDTHAAIGAAVDTFVTLQIWLDTSLART